MGGSLQSGGGGGVSPRSGRCRGGTESSSAEPTAARSAMAFNVPSGSGGWGGGTEIKGGGTEIEGEHRIQRDSVIKQQA